MRDKTILSRRQWLRPARSWGPQSSTHTSVVVESYDWNGQDQNTHIQGEIGIRDCSNYVSLDFHADSDSHYVKQLAAIDKLMGELTKFRVAFDDAHTEVIKRGGWKCT